MTKEGKRRRESLVKSQVIDFLFLGKITYVVAGVVLWIDGDRLPLKPHDITEMAAYLNLTERHVKRLIGNLKGLVKKTYVRHGVGRPRVMYTLNRQGILIARKHLDEIRNLTQLRFMKDSYAKGDQNENTPESYGFPEFVHSLPVVKGRVQRCPLGTFASYERGQNYKNCVTCDFWRATIGKRVVCYHPGSGIPLKRASLAKYVDCIITRFSVSGMERAADMYVPYVKIELFDCDQNFMENFWALLLRIPNLRCDSVPWSTGGLPIIWDIEIRELGFDTVYLPDGLYISPSKVRRKFERWKSRNPQLSEQGR